MALRTDRREISRLLLPHFPTMANATSDEWGEFLDKATGLTTDPAEANGVAFDRWRQALAAQGYPVWGYTPENLAKIKADTEKYFTDEAKRLNDFPELMAKLRKDAPLVTAAELMKKP